MVIADPEVESRDRLPIGREVEAFEGANQVVRRPAGFVSATGVIGMNS